MKDKYKQALFLCGVISGSIVAYCHISPILDAVSELAQVKIKKHTMCHQLDCQVIQNEFDKEQEKATKTNTVAVGFQIPNEPETEEEDNE